MSIVPFAANHPLNTLPEEEVTQARLLALLTSAYFEATIDDDGDIYLNDGLEFPIWVGVLPEDRLVQLFTYVGIEDANVEWTFERLNELNRRIKVPQFHLVDQKYVYGNWWLPYDGGLSAKQFIRSIRRFASAFLAGVRLDGKSCAS